MEIKNWLAIISGKITYYISSLLNLGAGGTWPGEISTRFSPNILSELFKSLDKGIIIVAGTNGKTTTSLMIRQILEKAGNIVIHNGSGANLLNGVVSALIRQSDWLGRIKADWGVFEVDENSFSLILSEIKNQKSKIKNHKLIIVLLNLFRDQLDRYGEVDVIVEKWGKALKKLPDNSTLILNADDPGVAWLSQKVILGSEATPESKSKDDSGRARTSLARMTGTNKYLSIKYFGLNDPKLFSSKHEHAMDSTFCLNCGSRLTYSGIFYSHLGHWKCPTCINSRIDPDISDWSSTLPGLYNQYNTLAAVSVVKSINISDKLIKSGLKDFHPAFGRQEEFEVDGKKIKIFLSKNPAGFNASLRTVLELKPNVILLVLNDRIPDGRDVSWIWDVDFEQLTDLHRLFVSGDRCYDLGLRLKYAGLLEHKLQIFTDLKESITKALESLIEGETLYILPTYSAMLDVRKIISGRKIL